MTNQEGGLLKNTLELAGGISFLHIYIPTRSVQSPEVGELKKVTNQLSRLIRQTKKDPSNDTLKAR